jgi:hypothetical protein
MTMITDVEIARHLIRDDDKAEILCRHLGGDAHDELAWYYLPDDPVQLVPSTFCCRCCLLIHLSEGSKPREREPAMMGRRLP